MTDTPLPGLAAASPHAAPTLHRRRDVGLVCLVGLLCGAGALGVAPLGPQTMAAAAAGIATPLLWRHGRALWPGIWLAAFALALIGSHSVVTALFVATLASLASMGAARVLERRRVDLRLERRRDATWYGALAIGTALVAALAACGAAGFVDAAPPALAVGLRALAAAACSALVLGAAVLHHRAGTWPIGRRAAPLAGVVLVLAAGTALLPGELAQMTTVAVGALLYRLGWSCGAWTASATAAAALLLRLAVERFALPMPADESSWRGAVDLITLALLWGTLPTLAAAWRSEAEAREQGWLRLVEAAETGTIALDLAGRRIALSKGWHALLDLATLPTEPEGFWTLVHPDDLPALRALLMPAQGAARPGEPLVVRLRHGSQAWRRVRIAGVDVQFDERGAVRASRAVAQDVNDAVAAAERARVADSLYDQLGEGLLVTDAQGRVVRANTRYAEITGESSEALVGTVPRLLRTALTSVAAGDPDSQIRRSGIWQGEVVDRRRNGELCTLALTVTQVRDAAGTVTHHTVLVNDLTQAREHRLQLERKALTDDLTQLPNRAHLVQLLEAAMQASDRHGNLLTVVSLDLDHFKAVNDRLGSEAGDRLLVELAQRLSAAQREVGNEVLARVGGDEFVLLMRTVDLAGSRQAVQRVLDTIALPFTVAGETLALSASIGATVYPTDRSDAETLLRHAGHALWGVKQAGRNAFQFFDAERHRQAEARVSALGRLQEAFDNDEFCLYFQPKVDMRRGKVLGAEALIRWAHPERGVLPPGEFLPLIENTPLAVDLGTWVLRKGVEQLAHWHRMGLEMTLSVNVSARLLQEPQFGKYIAGLLQRHRAPIGRKLILEVLETAALKDMERTSRLMDECHALGVRFALDDFGTGFSNLTYLRQLPVDMLKIDRSFVANMLQDKEDLAIVEGVLTLARTFGCTVVAEGVETAEQARRLIRMGCDVGQGYGISPPMPLDQLLAWAAEFKGMPGVVERRTAPV